MMACLMLALAACRNAKPTHTVAADTSGGHPAAATAIPPADSPMLAAVPPGRPALITELKEMHRLLASRDKGEIAKIFSFPVPDSVMGVYIDDSVFTAKYKESGQLLTAAMFEEYFDKISSRVNLQELDSLFANLDVDRLMRTNGLEAHADTESEPCTRMYRIAIGQDSTVELAYGVSSVNADYKPKTKKEAQDMAEEDGLCEHLTFWRFFFDGQKLHLVREDAAD